jgi:hypothetical protein
MRVLNSLREGKQLHEGGLSQGICMKFQLDIREIDIIDIV